MLFVAVDFDHTLVDHDLPLPGAKAAMQTLRDMGYKIVIHSCNVESWIRKILDYHEIPYDYVWDGKGKPVCDAYLDDRAVVFDGDYAKAIQEIAGIETRRRSILGLE